MPSKMLTRIITAVCVIAVVAFPIALGGMLMRILEIFIAVVGGYEISHMFDEKIHPAMIVMNVLAIGAVGLVPASYMPVVLAVWSAALFAMIIFDESKTADMTAYSFIITVILGLTIRTVDIFYFAENAMGWRAMLYVLLAAFVTDTGAYFFGVFFGKHKMIPRISPNKTWEGSVGGYFSGLIVSFVFGYFMLKELPVTLIGAGSVILPVIAQIGDLSYSAVKRRFGIKDFGNLLPGHGGVLDRIDSMTFCLIMFNALMIMWGM